MHSNPARRWIDSIEELPTSYVEAQVAVDRRGPHRVMVCRDRGKSRRELAQAKQQLGPELIGRGRLRGQGPLEHERSVLQLSTSRIDGKVVSGASSCAQMPLPHPHVRAGDEVSGRAWVGDLSPANGGRRRDRKSTRLNSSHLVISYAVFCLKKKKKTHTLN